MSLPQQKNAQRPEETTSSLLLDEPYTPVQLGLRHLFGTNEAELIQNVNFWINTPWQDYSLKLSMRTAFDDNRWWVRIPPRILTDRFTGRARDLSESTLKRTFTSCINQGVMLVRTDLNDDDEKNVRWAALLHEVLDPQIGIYQQIWRQVINERKAAILNTGRLLPAKREQELWDEMQLRLAQARETLRTAGLYDLHKIYEPAGGQNEPHTYKASSASVRRAKMNPMGGQNEPVAASKRTSAKSKVDPETASPPYRKDKDKEKDKEKESAHEARPVSSSSEIQFHSLAPSAEAATPPGSGLFTGIKKRLMEFAELREITISDAQADTLIASWPAAHLDQQGLYYALTRTPKRFGLDEPIQKYKGRDIAREMVSQDEERLRWQLCSWVGFPAARDDYAGRGKFTKTSCFIGAFKDEHQPPASWLENELSALAQKALEEEKRAQAIREAERKRAFGEWRADLMPNQIEALQSVVRAELAKEYPGGSKMVWDDKVTLSVEMRAWSDGATRAEIEAGVIVPEVETDENAPAQAMAALFADLAASHAMPSVQPSNPAELLRELQSAHYDDPELNAQVQRMRGEDEVEFKPYGSIPEATQLRLEVYTRPILRDLNAGLLSLDELEERMPKRLSDEDKELVRRIIEERMTA